MMFGIHKKEKAHGENAGKWEGANGDGVLGIGGWWLWEMWQDCIYVGKFLGNMGCNQSLESGHGMGRGNGNMWASEPRSNTPNMSKG